MRRQLINYINLVLKGLKFLIEVTSKTLDTDIKSIKKAARKGVEEELIKRVEANNTLSDWTILKGKANVSQKDRQIKLSINIKNKKDSIIWR